MKSILFINTIRYLILSFALLGLICHFVQCTLLNVYQEKTGIPGWIEANHWQYFAWYISLSTSILSGMVLGVQALFHSKAHILRGDKCLGIINIVLLSLTIGANTFFNNEEPWTNGIVQFKNPSKGLVLSCTFLDQNNDIAYPLLFQRCLLVNTTYVISALVCTLWVILVCCTLIFHPRKPSSVAKFPSEKGWKTNSKKNSISKNSHLQSVSSGFDNHAFQYQPNEVRASTKYNLPIAPHAEKLELPKSYDVHFSRLYHSDGDNRNYNADYYPLSRHYSPHHIPGGWIENKYTPETSAYYY